MNVLFFGDVIGKTGREALKRILPRLKKKYAPDLIIANCENVAHGKGVTARTFQEVSDLGVQVFTSGNHIWSQKEAIDLLERKDSLILRPANYPPGVPGRGYLILEVGTKKVAVINLVGRVFFQEDFDCPFRKADEILTELAAQKVKIVIIDFHAEATSEANALAWYLDGRVSLMAGTHTHVQTADERILPQGTASISDVGMVGARDSIIGVDRAKVLKNFLTQMPLQLEVASGAMLVSAIFVQIDPVSGKAGKIERILETIQD